MCGVCGARPRVGTTVSCTVCKERNKKVSGSASGIARRKRYRAKLCKEVFDHYGHKCACCEETEPAFLTIDHIDGGGKAEARAERIELYRRLRQRGFPEGFQTLCWNCNSAKHILGICPHQK